MRKTGGRGTLSTVAGRDAGQSSAGIDGSFLPDADLLLSLKVVPKALSDGTVTFVAGDDSDRGAAASLAAASGLSARFETVSATVLELALEKLHEEKLGAESENLGNALLGEDSRPYLSDRRQSRIEMLVRRALDEGASDLHLQPAASGLLVRLRVDGKLRTVELLPLEQASGLIAQIKVLARLPLAGRRLPQDGRLSIAPGGTVRDLRVSIVPSIHGEAAVLRLEGGEAPRLLENLGLDNGMLASVRRLLSRRGGMILAVGPTGSGKTSTLYAMMRELAGPEKKLVSVEEPVERTIGGVNQVPVEKGGMGFSDAIRAMLRHSPDAMMIGEIRDQPTASAAAEAALTGHLVLATVHARDGAEAVLRLADLGVPREVLSCVVEATLSQRLVRLLCRDCSRPEIPSPALSRVLGLSEGERAACRAPVGCPACAGTGHRGRRAIFSLMEMNATLRGLLTSGAGANALRVAASESGTTPLADEAHRLAAMGLAAPGEAAVAAGLAGDGGAVSDDARPSNTL